MNQEWEKKEKELENRQNIIGQNGNDGDHYSELLPVYLDTETTGLFPSEGAEMIELAIVAENGEVLFDSFIKPEKATEWPEAERINKISPDMVKDAPTLSDVADKIKAILKGRTVYIWNADFDVQFLPGLVNDSRVVCAMREFGDFIEQTQPQNISPTGRYKLEYTANDLGVDFEGQPHRALTDVLTTIHVRQAWQKTTRTNLSGSVNVEAYSMPNDCPACDNCKNGIKLV